MKKLLGLVLLFILVAGISLVFLMSRSNVGSGNWDLNSPANNSYIASFPALVRANQTAIVASLTPPIEWTGDVTQYGTPSAKLGFGGLTGGFSYPTFWLGSIGTSAAYIFGPSEQVPVGIPNDDAPGWYAHVASYPSADPGEKCYLQLGMPNGNGTAQAAGILIREDLISVNRKVSGVATGASAQDAVNVGQMSASISYALNNLATGTDNTDAVNVGQLNASITGASTFLTMTDTPSSYSGNGGKVLAVNSAGTAVEFTSLSNLTSPPAIGFSIEASYNCNTGNASGTISGNTPSWEIKQYFGGVLAETIVASSGAFDVTFAGGGGSGVQVWIEFNPRFTGTYAMSHGGSTDWTSWDLLTSHSTWSSANFEFIVNPSVIYQANPGSGIYNINMPFFGNRVK